MVQTQVPGVDDALALLLAMKSSELHVEAITTVSGNVHVEQATQNLLTILGVLDLPDYPIIAQGEAKPLVKPLVKAEHYQRYYITFFTECYKDFGESVNTDQPKLTGLDQKTDALLERTDRNG